MLEENTAKFKSTSMLFVEIFHTAARTKPHVIIDRIIEKIESRTEDNLTYEESGILQCWVGAAESGADPRPCDLGRKEPMKKTV